MKMAKILKLCPNCYSKLTEEDFEKDAYVKYEGDFRYVESDCNECPKCGSELIPCSLTEPERLIIAQVSDYSRDVFDAMRKLKTEDPIEFTLKIGQFKQLYEETKKANKPVQQQNTQNIAPTKNLPKCPRCGSTAITAGQRGYSLMWGFIGSSNTVNRCSNCGHKWKPGK